MARKRMLSPEFFQSETLASCSPHARLLFAGLWTLCDRDGRMRYLPPVVHGQVFPYEPDIDIRSLMSELETVGCVRTYRSGPKTFLDIPGFAKWQRPHAHEPNGDSPPWESRDVAIDEECPSQERTTSVPDRSYPESESESESERSPPNPPAGGSQGELIPNSAEKVVGEEPKRRRRKSKYDDSPEALKVLARWKDLQAAHGTQRRMKAFPAGWGVQARIDEYDVEAVIEVVEWAHLSDDVGARRLREGGHLEDTLFRPSKFPKYEGHASAWARRGGGRGFHDHPDDYELPDIVEFVPLRGKQVQRYPSGSWLPNARQLADPALPWRPVLDAVARERLAEPGADIYRPEPFHEALRQKCQFVLWGLGSDRKVNEDVQWAIDAALNDAREGAGR